MIETPEQLENFLGGMQVDLRYEDGNLVKELHPQRAEQLQSFLPEHVKIKTINIDGMSYVDITDLCSQLDYDAEEHFFI